MTSEKDDVVAGEILSPKCRRGYQRRCNKQTFEAVDFESAMQGE